MNIPAVIVLAILALSIDAAEAQPVFQHSRVQFEAFDRVDLDKARDAYDGNVFIFFYRDDHPAVLAADSVFLGNERISTLLNERYARAAIDVESDYARVLFSQVELGGPTDGPFILLLNLDRPAHQGIWSNWDARNPLLGVDEMMLDRMYWQLSNFAEYGTTEP